MNRKLLALSAVATGLRVIIPYRTSECIKISGVPSSRTMITFEVLSPADGQVSVTIQRYLDDSNSKTQLIPAGPPQHSGSYELSKYVEKPSTFLVCYRAAEQVKPGTELMFAVDSDPREQELGLATIEHTEGLLKAAKVMRDVATDLYRAQSFKTTRWKNYNATLIEGHQRLKFWRITQSLGVGGFVCAQIFFVRHVFNRKAHLLG